MSVTSVSLLDRLKAARPDASDWNRLQGIYLPLIQRWLGRVPGLGDESADLAQEVLIVVFREVPRFDRRREGSFRAWLRRVTVNRIRIYCRKRRRQTRCRARSGRRISRTACPTRMTTSLGSGTEITTSMLFNICWRSCNRPSVRRLGRPFSDSPSTASRPVRVAEELGLSENAVILAKSRVLKRLRQEAGDLLR